MAVYVSHAMIADAGIVRSQAQTILLATPHLTADTPNVAPDPNTEPLTQWVVLTGIPNKEEPIITEAADVSTENPCTGSIFVSLNPTVLSSLHPPKRVPRVIRETTMKVAVTFRLEKRRAPSPALVTPAPTRPPIKACDELVGSPRSHVIMSQRIAPTSAASTTF